MFGRAPGRVGRRVASIFAHRSPPLAHDSTVSRRTDYVARMHAGEAPEAIAAAESGLPGPRGNLELIAAIADVADAPTLLAWAAEGPDAVSGNEPHTVLVMAGIVGIGRLLADGWRGPDGRLDLVERLRVRAADPRWRVREGVAMAVQRWAESDAGAAFSTAEAWAHDEPFVQRAGVAAVCEPALLARDALGRRAVAIVDRVTADLAATPGRRGADVDALKKTLGYGWSVAVVGDPATGRPAFERWFESSDPAIRWIVRENLKKSRLTRLDDAWVARSRARIEGWPTVTTI
jgi:hypothetical protein